MPSYGSPEEKRQRAQAHFEKAEQRKVEAAKSRDDYRAQINADVVKTIRLRALRLAKEAEDKLAAKILTEKKLARAALPKKLRAKPIAKTGSVAES